MFGKSDGSVTIEINGDSDKFKSALNTAKSAAATAGNAIVVSLKAVGVAIGTVSAGIIAIGKTVVSEYANYEQLVGGVETLFGAGGKSLEEYAESVGKTVDEAAAKYAELSAAEAQVVQNAENAYKTAGMSANDYMETVTSFSASLISSLDGDTVKAAEYAQTAIVDMSDNANKMGTDMESIQNAYQGFAKQNYTMLDNLKLGYGGTKEEMERLLADAEELQAEMGNSVDYDISSYADVIEAIHTIQESMSIAGTTAAEAEETISGSINTLKAAFENLLAGLGNADADIQGLIDNVVEAFNTVVTNISPIVDNIIAALPSAFEKISAALSDLLPELLSTVTKSAAEIVTVLADGISDNIGVIVNSATEIVSTLIDTLKDLIPTVKTVAVEIITSFCTFISGNAADIIQIGIDIITSLADGIAEALPQIIPAAIQTVVKIAETIIDNIDKIIDTAGDILDGLANALTDTKMWTLLSNKIPEIVIRITDKLIESIPEVLRFTGDFLKKIADELVNYDWSDTAKQVMDNIATALDDAQKSVSVMLDNIFSGGEVYGGDVNNVSSTDFIKYYRDGAEIVEDNIAEAQKSISTVYNEGKQQLNDMLGVNDSEITGLPFTMRVQGDKIAEAMAHCSSETVNSAEEISDALSNSVDTVEMAGESFESLANTASTATVQISDDFKAFYEALKLAKAKGEISDDEYISQLKAKLNSSLEYNTSLYTSYWSEVTTAEERAAETALKAEEELQEELEKQREQAAQERLEQQKEAANAELNQFIFDTDKLTSEYKSKLSELQSDRDSFKSKLSENVFATETITDSRTGETTTVGGIVNLQQKINARKELGNYLESLVKKGIPKGMLSEIAAMDPEEGLQFAKQLDGLNDDKWQSIVTDYNEYEAVNEEIANQVYGPQITALNEQYANDMTSLLDTVTEGAAEAGAQALKEFIRGIDLSSDEAMTEIENKLSEIGDSISTAISDGTMFEDINTESVGVSIAEGIAEGIISQSDTIRNALEAALNDTDLMTTLKTAVDLKASSYTPASTSSVTNNTSIVNNNRYLTAPTTQSGEKSVIYLDVNLLLKDGTKLAEIVNATNNRIAITTGG